MNVTTFSLRAPSLVQTKYENDKSKTLSFTIKFVLPELVNSTEFEAMSFEADTMKLILVLHITMYEMTRMARMADMKQMFITGCKGLSTYDVSQFQGVPDPPSPPRHQSSAIA